MRLLRTLSCSCLAGYIGHRFSKSDSKIFLWNLDLFTSNPMEISLDLFLPLFKLLAIEAVLDFLWFRVLNLLLLREGRMLSNTMAACITIQQFNRRGSRAAVEKVCWVVNYVFRKILFQVISQLPQLLMTWRWFPLLKTRNYPLSFSLLMFHKQHISLKICNKKIHFLFWLRRSLQTILENRGWSVFRRLHFYFYILIRL